MNDKKDADKLCDEVKLINSNMNSCIIGLKKWECIMRSSFYTELKEETQ